MYGLYLHLGGDTFFFELNGRLRSRNGELSTDKVDGSAELGYAGCQNNQSENPRRMTTTEPLPISNNKQRSQQKTREKSETLRLVYLVPVTLKNTRHRLRCSSTDRHTAAAGPALGNQGGPEEMSDRHKYTAFYQ